MPKKRPKAEDWTDPTGLLLLQSWAQQGLTQDQICENMERLRGVPISRRSLARWMSKCPATIGAALHNGRGLSIAVVENALFQKAAKGDLGAICFYLKNKCPDRWSEHPELRGMNGKVVFIDDIPATQPAKPAADKPAGEAEQPDNS